MLRMLWPSATVAVAAAGALASVDASTSVLTQSGVRPWVDVYTPSDAQTVKSSRGGTWELVMSDEFNVPGRDFAAGKDHMWTALEMPDGVNAALEYYSVNMTSTKNISSDRGVFQIETREDEVHFSVFNAYTRPPSFENHTMYYRAGMLQSWNKFCFQGGRVEVKARLPGAISAASGNPDLGDSKARVEHIEYYPTWPGIWFLGNLGRALFTGSTGRMWPWSYDECNEELSSSQRINACDGNPGHGLNPHQGRGAPEIDLLEGGGTDVSTSIQVAPGMPEKFRLFPPKAPDDTYCVYSYSCDTKGANYVGIPRKLYDDRGYNSWYQGLRYAANTICTPKSDQKQDPQVVIANFKKGITDNKCSTVNACPASNDGYSSLSKIDGEKDRYWGVNEEGGCMPRINGYQGSYLCDPDNTSPKCSDPLRDGNEKSNVMDSFNYQMDALSANSGLPLEAYQDFLTYQMEWVTGRNGYVRWEVEGVVIYEIPAEAMENPPQDKAKSNPKKLMLEEPMYVIFNVALSTSWGSKPPNPGKKCRGDGTNEQTNRICDEFPMYLQIDYVRVYQDVSSNSTMSVGCDPSTHPTKTWIEDHLEEYEDSKNKVIDVQGGAPCFSDEDCSVSKVAFAAIVTGKCRSGRCSCSQKSWGGPRCTFALDDSGSGATTGYGPSVAIAFAFGALVLLLLAYVAFKIIRKRDARLREQAMAAKMANDQQMADLSASEPTSSGGRPAAV